MRRHNRQYMAQAAPRISPLHLNPSLNIPASNYSQQKYCISREVYDAFYDFMVRIGRVGIEKIAEKGRVMLPIKLRDVLNDPAGADFFEKTWSFQSSDHRRFSVCHGQYAGFVTNASSQHREFMARQAGDLPTDCSTR
jgi:hypothetical protein